VEARRRTFVIVVLMGVSGCGKSTVAGVLAGRLHWPLAEGDGLHPPENVAKMAAGHPLTDDDRRPWLQRIRQWMTEREAAGESGIVTCSALKRRYRDLLRDGDADPNVVFVYLHASREQLLARVTARQGHFMPASLLDSQLADLEPPGPDEHAVRVEIGPAPAAQADAIIAELDLDGRHRLVRGERSTPATRRNR
jgi:carbohydrate kinase (thermoresistant glucokinase family)